MNIKHTDKTRKQLHTLCDAGFFYVMYVIKVMLKDILVPEFS